MAANVLIMAGGTGGHVFPALACAREFQARGYSVHWLGLIYRRSPDPPPSSNFDRPWRPEHHHGGRHEPFR